MLENVALSRETLARAFEQSVDCVKLLSRDGHVLWMNANGQCAMEVEDFSKMRGLQWASLWPVETRHIIERSLAEAGGGDVVRFDALCPTAKGSPRWWNVSISSVEDENGQPSGFLSISRDITTEEKAKQAASLAKKEIQHRLGNTLAIVSAMMIGFARGTPDREAFAKEMQKRLIALNSAQKLFSSDQLSCDVDTLMTALIAPFEGSNAPLTIGIVPSVLIDRAKADAIALVVGELVVNSIKHGALGKPGTVHIEVVHQDGYVRVIWTEKLTDAVKDRSRDGGQGLALIRDIVAACEGIVETNWQDAGLIVTVTFDAE